MAELSITWYAAVIILTLCLLKYLSRSFSNKSNEDEFLDRAIIKGNWVKEEKKKSKKKQTQKQAKKEPVRTPSPDAAVVEKKSHKTVKLRKEKGTEMSERVAEVKARGIDRLEESDDEGFTTVVGSRTKGMMKKLSKMSKTERSAFLAEQERKNDAKWDIDPDKIPAKSKNAFMLPKTEGKAVPKKKTERKTATINPSAVTDGKIHLKASPEMLAEIERLRKAESALPDVNLSYKVSIEGSWYPISELLSTADFAHAESLYKRWVANPQTCLGCSFLRIEGKDWTGAATADEPWVVSGWVPALLKLISGDKEAYATVCTEGDWRVKMTLVSEDVVQMEHVDRPAKLSSAVHKVSLKQLSEAFQKELSLLVDFMIKIESVSESFSERMTELRDSNPERADRNLERHATVQGRLPKTSKLNQNIDRLSEALIMKWG
eukprot:TRINITY_DN11454_c0_g1_i1.p1 TRINITY_DN11454_c0_g1~~TRINITY_DN11454_c0_g1_i1.p1  ORF type:complete len:453 (+),score=108.18 TRINITY_DN11454_c0_g1_i1:58-1359(+)